MKIRGTHRFSTLLVSLAGVLFLFTFSVVLVLSLRQIYYHDADALHVEDELKRYSDLDLTTEQIKANYDVLIDYNQFWKKKEKLVFPDFPMSEHGEIHFQEVKEIFVFIQYTMILSLFLLIFGLWFKIRSSDIRCLKWTAVLTILIPLLLGSIVALNWDWFFVTFHQIMFSNDYWLFDYRTDPIILVLPDEFFFHCAAGILICLLAGSAGFFLFYQILNRKFKNRKRKSRRLISRK